ncbi:MAG: DNA internalization-related competence protein ComEC/Rec2 [Leptothrix sp. (in: b-proteobacteria)]
MRHGLGLLTGVLGVLLGTALQLQQAELWHSLAYPGLVGTGLALTGLAGWRSRRWPWLAAMLALLAGLALGVGQAGWRAQVRLAESLPAELELRDLEVIGVVASLPVRRIEGVRFQFDVDSARRLDTGAAVVLPRRLALGWYLGWQEGALLIEPMQQLRPGQRWRLVVRLKRPHGTLNPDGFDYELWLFEQGVRATGSVRSAHATPAELLVDAAGTGLARLGYQIDRWRQQLRDALYQQLGDTPAAGVLAALVIGDQAAIDQADWDVFRSTGVAHLVAISGLHVTMFAWVAGALVAFGWRRSRRLMLALPAGQAGRWGGLGCAAAYALLAGWGVPSQRTVFMLAATTMVRAVGWRWPWFAVLGLAALVVTLLDPWALLQPGFWLSFVAVAMLFVQDAGVPQPAKHPVADVPDAVAEGWLARHVRAVMQLTHAAAREGLRTQLLMTLGLAPLTLLFFHQMSLVGLLANLVAIPWITLLVTPLALLGVLLAPLWSLAAWLVSLLMQFLAVLAAWPLASWQAPAAPIWAVCVGLLGGGVLALPLPRRLRLLGLPLMLPLLDAPLALPPEGQFTVLAADIGQGNAVLVRTRQHTLLYDTGPQYSRDSDAGERVLVPLLHALGIVRLDLLVLSHRDQDHVGGAAAVLRGVGAWRVMGSLEAGHRLRELAPFQPCQVGQSWVWDGVRFEVLHPRPVDYLRAARGELRTNGLSCVLRISASRPNEAGASGPSILLAGDIEREQELILLETQATRLRSDVLLVPHHGSRTSSTAEWLSSVAPSVAVVQSGYLNRYGHPSPMVLDRYRMHAVGVIRTDTCGAWHWNSASAAYWCERMRSGRYWHAPLQGDGPELAKIFSFIDNQP